MRVKNARILGGEEAIVKESVVNLVDLAGNERLMYEGKKDGGDEGRSKSWNLGDKKINESKHINKSLFYLTQVIKLVSKKDSKIHIPFRNSPLTKILRSSFGGHSRTLLILCCAPGDKDFEITLSTLRFGKQAKKIENKIVTNMKTNFNSNNFEAIIRSYEDKVTGFYNKLNEMEREHRVHEKEWEKMGHIKEKVFE